MKESILGKILGYVGFILFLLAMSMVDSDWIFVPAALLVVGMALLLWSAYEEGYIRRRKR